MQAFKLVLRTISHILSVVLCILLLFSTLATMLVADLRVASNKDNLQKVLNATLSAPPKYTFGPISGSTTIPPELDLNAFLSGDITLTESLVDYALQMLQDSNVEIEKEAIEQFVEESTIKDYIAEKSASIVSDLITGENTTTITGEEIKELVIENKELLEEHFDLVVSEEELDNFAQVIDELPPIQEIQQNGVSGLLTGNQTTPDEGSDSLESDETVSSNPMTEILNIVRQIATDTVFFTCLSICAVLIALLFLFAWNKPYIAMLYSGTAISLTGLIFMIPTLIATNQPATWMGLFSNIPAAGPIIGGATRIVLMLTSSVCYTVTGVGAVLFVGGIVLFIVMKKAKKAKAAKAAAIKEAPAASPFAVAAAELYETTPVVEEAPAAEAAAEEAPAEEPAAEEAVAEEAVAEEVAPAEEAAPVETV